MKNKEIEKMVFKKLTGLELDTKPINGWIILQERLTETPLLYYQYKEKFAEIMGNIKKAIESERDKVEKEMIEVLPKERQKDFGAIGNDTDKAYELGKQIGYNTSIQEIKSKIQSLLSKLK